MNYLNLEEWKYNFNNNYFNNFKVIEILIDIWFEIKNSLIRRNGEI